MWVMFYVVADTIHGIIEKENDDKVDALINPEDKSGCY